MMAEQKPKNRRVARPRLLKALLDVMVEHDLGLDSLIGSLVDAIKDDIVEDAMR